MPDLVRPSGDGLGVYYLHQIQNHLNDWLIADRGIDHGVVDGTVGPFDVEVFLDEIRAFPINRIHELLRFTSALAARKQTTELVFSEHKETRAACPAWCEENVAIPVRR